MANPVSSRLHDASNTNMLSTLQASKGDTVRNDGFSRALENSVRNHEQAPPREANRSESRRQPDASDPARRNRAESKPADTANRPSDSRKTVDSDSTGTTSVTEQKSTVAADGASAAEDVSVAEEAAAEDVAVGSMPANLAVLASIIAALDRAATAQAPAPADAEAEAEVDLLGSTRRSAGSVLSGLLEKSAGKGGEAARDAAAKDTAGAIAAADTKQLKADAGTISGNFSRVLATIAQPQTYSAPAATALQALAAESPAAPGVLSNTFVPGMRTEPSAIPQLQVHTPAGQRVWAEEVGSRLMWMVGRGESRAELVLTPPSLGRLGVSIQVNGDQTTAHFVASSAAAREALEQALPRLREALQLAGINLGQTDVSTSGGHQRSTNDSQDEREPSLSRGGESDAASGEIGLPSLQTWTRAGSGLIDTFA